MKDKKNLVMVIIIGITISLFFCFNTTAFATTGIVTTSDLRLRKEESTKSEILTLLDENDKVEIISENGDWYKVKANGKVGYVSKQFIKVKDNNVVDNVENTTNNEEKKEENKEENNNSEENKNEEANKAEENKNTEEQANNENVQINKIKEGTVNSDTQIRIMPLINVDAINDAKSGEKYLIVNTAGLWSYVKNNEKCGWILTEKLAIQEVVAEGTENKEEKPVEEKPVEEKTVEEKPAEEKKEESTEKKYSSVKKYYVKGTSVNARSQANKSSNVVEQLDTNQEVKVTGEDGNWYVVDLNGKKAYILKTLLSSKKVEVTSRTSTTIEENKATEQKTESKPVETAQAANPPSSSSGEAVVAYAKQFLGYRYVYGTNGPNTFDCSGFVQYVYKHFGVSLSRSSKTQANDGVAVSKSNLQPGDVLIFKNTAKTAIGHVGIYIGNNQFIHASNSKTGVIISSLSTSSYQQRYVTARRIL